MKTVMVWVAVALVCVIVVLWVGAAVMTGLTAQREWPGGLGKLSEAPQRNAPTWESDDAAQLVTLAAAMGIELRPGVRRSPVPRAGEPRQALDGYVRAQLERSGDAIDAQPAAVERWLAENAEPLDAVRDHLLGAEEIVWASDPRGDVAPVPNFAGHIHLNRLLVARSLERARHGDSAAWDELRAARELNHALWKRPEVIAIIVAVSSSRMLNAAARKMPLPAPAWLAETFAFDYEREAWRAQQAEVWRTYQARGGRGNSLQYFRAMREAERTRRITAEVIRTNVCDVTSSRSEPVRAVFDSRRAPNILGAWQRLLRFRVEREATQRVLQLRSGQVPSRESRCSDGSWEITPTSAKFTREVKLVPPTLDVPLQYP